MASLRPGPGETLLAAGVEPIQPGVYLAERVFTHRNVTIGQAAEAMGLPYDVVAGIITDRQDITRELAERLYHYTNLSIEFWLNLQSAYDLFRRSRRTMAE